MANSDKSLLSFLVRFNQASAPRERDHWMKNRSAQAFRSSLLSSSSPLDSMMEI